MGGAWDLIFAMFTKSDYEFYDLKNQLISEYGDIIVNIYGDALLDVKQYPKSYFLGKVKGRPTMFAGEIVKNELDALDYRILTAMINDARVPLTKLAKKVSSTPQTVHRRMNDMIDKGVIIQFRIGVNLQVLGLEHYKAIIHLSKYSKKDEKRLAAFFSSLLQTQYLIRNLWNIEVEFVVRNYNEYREIMETAKERFPNVIRNVESVIFKTDEWTPGFENFLLRTD